jgi:single-strand DNA-binding protein
MNSLSVIARLGKDAEMRTLPNGNPVLQFTAAFDSGYGDKKTTTWLQCAIFGKRASENLCNCLVKGTQVGLVGEIKLDEWQGNDGTTQKTLKMMVGDLTLVGDRQQQSQPQQNQPPQQYGQPQSNQQHEIAEDDIPF